MSGMQQDGAMCSGQGFHSHFYSWPYENSWGVGIIVCSKIARSDATSDAPSNRGEKRELILIGAQTEVLIGNVQMIQKMNNKKVRSEQMENDMPVFNKSSQFISIPSLQKINDFYKVGGGTELKVSAK